jgi:hypothetical protein
LGICKGTGWLLRIDVHLVRREKYASMKTARGWSQNHGIDLYLDQHLWVHKASFANNNHGSSNGTWICIVLTVPCPKDLL